jgi:hypothetical protein
VFPCLRCIQRVKFFRCRRSDQCDRPARRRVARSVLNVGSTWGCTFKIDFLGDRPPLTHGPRLEPNRAHAAHINTSKSAEHVRLNSGPADTFTIPPISRRQSGPRPSTEDDSVETGSPSPSRIIPSTPPTQSPIPNHLHHHAPR